LSYSPMLQIHYTSRRALSTSFAYHSNQVRGHAANYGSTFSLSFITRNPELEQLSCQRRQALTGLYHTVFPLPQGFSHSRCVPPACQWSQGWRWIQYPSLPCPV